MSSARYCKAWRVATARTGPLRVPSAPLTARVHKWLAEGYSLTQIAAATGCSRRTVGDLARSRHATALPDTARKITATSLNARNIPDYEPIDATGTRRRLQALIAIGHPLGVIARELDHAPGSLSKVINGHFPTVRRTTARSVAALYREWSAQPGTCARSRNRAASDGWPGPLAWNNIDDPSEQPDVDGGEATASKIELARQCRDEALHLARFGTPPHEIAARINRAESTVRDLIRKTNPALLTAISA